MAFIDFNDASLQTLAPQALAAPTQKLAAPTLSRMAETLVRPAEALTALERRIIELARGDGLVTLRPRRKRSWLARLVLGAQAPSPVLANERLEALRRLAVYAWHQGYQLPASALKAAYVAGYTEAQIGVAIDTIVRLREPFRRLAA